MFQHLSHTCSRSLLLQTLLGILCSGSFRRGTPQSKSNEYYLRFKHGGRNNHYMFVVGTSMTLHALCNLIVVRNEYNRVVKQTLRLASEVRTLIIYKDKNINHIVSNYYQSISNYSYIHDKPHWIHSIHNMLSVDFGSNSDNMETTKYSEILDMAAQWCREAPQIHEFYLRASYRWVYDAVGVTMPWKKSGKRGQLAAAPHR